MLAYDIRDIVKYFPGKAEPVNDHITLQIDQGEVFGILGSMGYLEIVANRAPAAQITGAGKGAEVNILFGGAAAAGKGA